jgi:hypothetical protein
MTDLRLHVDRCYWCGQPHSYPLDAAGHYSGPLPCDPARHVELQVEGSEFRAAIEAARAKVKH